MLGTTSLMQFDGDGVSFGIPVSTKTAERTQAASVWQKAKPPAIRSTDDPQLPTQLVWQDQRDMSVEYINKVMSSACDDHEKSLAKLVWHLMARKIKNVLDLPDAYAYDILPYHYETDDIPHAVMVRDILCKAVDKSQNDQRAREVDRLMRLAEEHRLIVEGRITRAARVIMSVTESNELTMPSMPQRQADETISVQALLEDDPTDYIAHLALAIANDEIRGRELHDVGVRKIRRYIRSGTPQTIG